MANTPLQNRLARFLRTNQAAFATDCEAVLKLETEEPNAESDRFPWPERFPMLISELSKQLEASAAGQGWDIDAGVLSSEDDGRPAAIQSLLLDAALVRNLMARLLNRFQASQSGSEGANPAEMTAAKTEAMEIFDRITTAEIATWISKMPPSGGAAEHEEEESNLPETRGMTMLHPEAVVVPCAPDPKSVSPVANPADPAKAQSPAIRPSLTDALLEELREHIHVVGTMVGRMRAALPSGRDDAPTAAVRHLQKMAALLDTLGISKKASLDTAPPDPIRLAPLHVKTFVDALGESFRPLAEYKKLRLAVKCDAALQTVETDAAKLQRAASLLLGNAVQYTVAGGISITARASGSDWTLTIEDSGPGIEPESLARLMNGGSFGEDRNCHGIAVSMELVRLLGGHIDADSILRRGSKFTICLPRTRRAAH